MRRRVGRGVVAAVVAAASIVLSAPPGATQPASNLIVLSGAESAEGIALGTGATFFAGALFAGDIYRGDLRRGAAALFIDAPGGRQAGGMAYDNSTGLLFVAGVFTGQAYVYDTKTGATVAVYDLADPDDGPVINDVAVAGGGAWFTNSTQPELYFVPIEGGVPGPARTLALSGPAALISGPFNLNGIAATANGKTLLVSHSANAALYLVDPASGASTAIEGLSLPNVDGIVLRGHRLWAVQNFSNQVSAVRLAADLGSGVVEHVITSPDFQTPTTALLHGDRLGVVNAKFDTGFPPTASQYEVVIVAS